MTALEAFKKPCFSKLLRKQFIHQFMQKHVVCKRHLRGCVFCSRGQDTCCSQFTKKRGYRSDLNCNLPSRFETNISFAFLFKGNIISSQSSHQNTKNLQNYSEHLQLPLNTNIKQWLCSYKVGTSETLKSSRDCFKVLDPTCPYNSLCHDALKKNSVTIRLPDQDQTYGPA